MTSNKCLKYSHPSKAQRLLCMDGLTWTTFPVQTPTRAVYQLSYGQTVAYKLCREAQAAHLFLQVPMGVGPYESRLMAKHRYDFPVSKDLVR